MLCYPFPLPLVIVFNVSGSFPDFPLSFTSELDCTMQWLRQTFGTSLLGTNLCLTLLPVWTLANHIAPQCLGFLICKIGGMITLVPPFRRLLWGLNELMYVLCWIWLVAVIFMKMKYLSWEQNEIWRIIFWLFLYYTIFNTSQYFTPFFLLFHKDPKIMHSVSMSKGPHLKFIGESFFLYLLFKALIFVSKYLQVNHICSWPLSFASKSISFNNHI